MPCARVSTRAEQNPSKDLCVHFEKSYFGSDISFNHLGINYL